MVRLRRAAAAAVLSALLVPLLAVVTAGNAGAATPEVGSCRNYGFAAQAAPSETSPAVSCRAPHTALVVAVYSAPSGVGSYADLTTVAVLEQAVVPCHRAIARTLGATEAKRRMSAYTGAFFYPTQTEWDAGARWVRCDLLLTGRGRLLTLPGKKRDVLEGTRLTDRARACRSTRVSYTFSCSSRHTHRAAGTFAIRQSAYPSRTQWTRKAERVCPRLAGARWIAVPPSRSAWQAGVRPVTCFRHATR